VQEHAEEYKEVEVGVLFYYVVRESGTNIYADEKILLECLNYHGTDPRIFKFVKRRDGTVVIWEVEAV